MADGVPPRDPGMDEPAPQPGAEPPPLDAIRVRGRGGRGLNKPAILITAGSGVALVLAMASGVFSGDAARKPAEAKPMMSDPARSEMAKGAIRELPADYTQVAPSREAVFELPPPMLGPPLPGDIAAFAPPQPDLRSHAASAEQVWDAPATQADMAPETDPAVLEAEQAERSGLFFSLREEPRPQATDHHPTAPHLPHQGRLTTFAPQPALAVAPDASSDRVLFPGAVIPASLVTAVTSESPGPVIAQVTQAIYDSATGRTLLIPQGARLIGDYKAATRYGQSRIAILWSSLIMPDGREVALDVAALDPAGAAGVPGEVNNHWAAVFGAAALGTLINVGVATTEDPELSYDGIGVTTRDPVDAAIADGLQRAASDVTSRVVDRGLAIPPTIRVPAGAKLTVIVTRRTFL